MTTGERSKALRLEAEEVLEMIRLRQLFASIGELAATGSYFMDLMMYPDIDLYLPRAEPEKLLAAAAELAKHPAIRRINYMRGGPGELKDGLYLKPVVDHGDWGRPWKIDIWSLPRETMERKQSELRGLKNRMTEGQKSIILETKHRLLNEEGRTPMFSGIHIYHAVIEAGLSDFNEIAGHLRRQGIKLAAAQ